jgi:hypothetical protein
MCRFKGSRKAVGFFGLEADLKKLFTIRSIRFIRGSISSSFHRQISGMQSRSPFGARESDSGLSPGWRFRAKASIDRHHDEMA